MKTIFLLSCFLAFIGIHEVYGRICTPSERKKCPKTPICPGGLTKDSRNCCDVCAKQKVVASNKCPKACPPKLAIKCQYGIVRDKKGCPICACNPPPKPFCLKVLCEKLCLYGKVIGKDGCPLCECNPPPCRRNVCMIACKYGRVIGKDGCPLCECNSKSFFKRLG